MESTFTTPRALSIFPRIPTGSYYNPQRHNFSPILPFRTKSHAVQSKKRTPKADTALDLSIVEEVFKDDEDEEEQLLFDEFDDDDVALDGEDEDFEAGYIEYNETELRVGDGGGGGGIALAGTWWDKEALSIAEEVCQSFDGTLQIYAFRTLVNSVIQVRIERLTNKSGSPSMEDIEAFSMSYRTLLDQAELAKTLPQDMTLEVSSPGVERVVRIPEDLNRFKDRPLYVKYATTETDLSSVSDGVFRLISFDVESKCCTWGLADVRVNREKAGKKGRPLNKKQREWQLHTSFDSLRLVRLYTEI